MGALNKGLLLLLALLVFLSLAHLALADWSRYSDEDEDSSPSYKKRYYTSGRLYKPSSYEDTNKDSDGENNYKTDDDDVDEVKKPVYNKKVTKRPVYKENDDDGDENMDLKKPLYKRPYKSKPFKPTYNPPKPFYKPYYKPKPIYTKPVYEKPIYTKPAYEKPIYTKPHPEPLEYKKPLPKEEDSYPIYSYKKPYYTRKPVPTYSSPASSSPSSHQKEWLDPHNAARAEVGLPPMVWSEEVARFAESWANQRRAAGCGLQHSDGPYGENIFWGSGDGYGPAECVAAWVREKASYKYAANSCSGGDCGHYTQIIWANSIRLGCAKARCGDGSVFMTCNYDPPGNYIGTKPY